MASEEIKEKIKIARESVKDEQEPYKTEAFKIILSSLIGGTQIIPKGKAKGKSKGKDKPTKSVNHTQLELEQKNELEILSKKCNITTDALSEVITIKNNIINIVKRPNIKESEKHVLFTACILACYRILYEIEWLPTNLLKKCLDESAVGDLGHYAEAIVKTAYVLPRGAKKGKEYKITGKGLEIAYEIIKKLSRDEPIVEN